MNLIQSGVPIRISAAGLLHANHDENWYPKMSCCEDGEPNFSRQSHACESNVCFAVLFLLTVGKQPAFPFPMPLIRWANENENNCLVIIFAQTKLDYWVAAR